MDLLIDILRMALIALVQLAVFTAQPAFGDSSLANVEIVGVVPTIFTVAQRGQGATGDLDLTPGVGVSNRTLALIHFKYNQNIQSLTVSSSTTSGFPEDASGNSYQFGGAGGFKVGFRTGCASVDPTYNTPFTLTAAGVDVKSALSANLVGQGIEEDCELTATYDGTTTALPLPGRYSMFVRVTMVAP